MLRMLIIFLILVGAFFAGPFMQGNQGAASFNIGNYLIEMSFATFLVLELVFLFLLYLLYQIATKIFHSKSFLGNWLRSKTRTKAAKQVELAQLCLLEGDYQQATVLFSKSAKNTQNKALFYLFDAQQQIDKNQLVSAYQSLEKAAEFCTTKEKFAFQIIQLRLQLKNRDYELARKTIEKQLAEKPRNIEVLKLAYQIYSDSSHYQEAIELLPMMQKVGIYNESHMEQLKQHTYLNLINQLASKGDPLALINWWKSQPKVVKRDVIYQNAMKKHLVPLTQLKEAIDLLASLNTDKS